MRLLCLMVLGLVGLSFFGPAAHAKTVREIAKYCAKAKNTDAHGENEEFNYPSNGPGQLIWRCMNGAVYVCHMGASGRACVQMDRDNSLLGRVIAFCQQNPGKTVPNSIAGNSSNSWECDGTSPMVTGHEALDEQGYLRSSWRPVSEVASTTDRLPIRDGRYARTNMPCDSAPMSARDVIVNGAPIHSPQYGKCDTHVLRQSNKAFRVTASCENGGPSEPPPQLYTIISKSQFTREGGGVKANFRWCSAL